MPCIETYQKVSAFHFNTISVIHITTLLISFSLWFMIWFLIVPILYYRYNFEFGAYVKICCWELFHFSFNEMTKVGGWGVFYPALFWLYWSNQVPMGFLEEKKGEGNCKLNPVDHKRRWGSLFSWICGLSHIPAFPSWLPN